MQRFDLKYVRARTEAHCKFAPDSPTVHPSVSIEYKLAYERSQPKSDVLEFWNEFICS